MSPNRRQHAYTLKQLLVALGLILLLWVMLTPTDHYFGSQETARRYKCLSNLLALTNALKIYHQDEGAYPPPLWEWTRSGDGRCYDGLRILYPDYLTHWKSLVCPDDYEAQQMSWENVQRSRYTSYDAEYNFYGYDPTAYPDQPLAIRDSQSLAHQSLLALWREAWLTPGQYPMLSNPNAPGHTIITLCHWHEPFDPPSRQVQLLVRVDGSAQAVKRCKIDYVFQEGF